MGCIRRLDEIILPFVPHKKQIFIDVSFTYDYRLIVEHVKVVCRVAEILQQE